VAIYPQSRLLYRAKGRQLRTVREEAEASKRRSEIQRKALAGTVQGLRDEVARWEEKLGETEEALRECREELGRCHEEVMDKGAAAGAAEERRGEEEARRRDAELQVKNVGPWSSWRFLSGGKRGMTLCNQGMIKLCKERACYERFCQQSSWCKLMWLQWNDDRFSMSLHKGKETANCFVIGGDSSQQINCGPLSMDSNLLESRLCVMC
jgi:hypothetical protein